MQILHAEEYLGGSVLPIIRAKGLKGQWEASAGRLVGECFVKSLVNRGFVGGVGIAGWGEATYVIMPMFLCGLQSNQGQISLSLQ